MASGALRHHDPVRAPSQAAAPRCCLPALLGYSVAYFGFSDMVRFMPLSVLHLAAWLPLAEALVAARCRTSCCASPSRCIVQPRCKDAAAEEQKSKSQTFLSFF